MPKGQCKTKLVALVMVLLAGPAACAGIQSRNVATPIDAQGKSLGSASSRAGIVVSGEELTDLSAPLFGAVELTFENRSNRWAHLEGVRVQFGSDALDKAVFVPTGSDLEAWSAATLQRNAIRSANREVALAGIGLGAAVASAAARPRSAAGAAAGVLALASLTALSTTATSDAIASTEHASLFPATHLLAGPISVPPGLFAKRWILFYTPDISATRCLTGFQLAYDLDDGTSERVYLHFREANESSKWQQAVCQSSSGAEPVGGH